MGLIKIRVKGECLTEDAYPIGTARATDLADPRIKIFDYTDERGNTWPIHKDCIDEIIGEVD